MTAPAPPRREATRAARRARSIRRRACSDISSANSPPAISCGVNGIADADHGPHAPPGQRFLQTHAGKTRQHRFRQLTADAAPADGGQQGRNAETSPPGPRRLREALPGQRPAPPAPSAHRKNRSRIRRPRRARYPPRTSTSPMHRRCSGTFSSSAQGRASCARTRAASASMTPYSTSSVASPVTRSPAAQFDPLQELQADLRQRGQHGQQRTHLACPHAVQHQHAQRGPAIAQGQKQLSLTGQIFRLFGQIAGRKIERVFR